MALFESTRQLFLGRYSVILDYTISSHCQAVSEPLFWNQFTCSFTISKRMRYLPTSSRSSDTSETTLVLLPGGTSCGRFCRPWVSSNKRPAGVRSLTPNVTYPPKGRGFESHVLCPVFSHCALTWIVSPFLACCGHVLITRRAWSNSGLAVALVNGLSPVFSR